MTKYKLLYDRYIKNSTIQPNKKCLALIDLIRVGYLYTKSIKQQQVSEITFSVNGDICKTKKVQRAYKNIMKFYDQQN